MPRSIVIDSLLKTSESGDTACIFVYFNHQDETRQVLKNLVPSLVAQLVLRRNECSDEVQKAYDTWEKRKMQPDTEEYIKILNAELNAYTRVYLVIDAMDECPDNPRTNTREEFLRVVLQLPSNVHILFTSRPGEGVYEEVQANGEIKITADEKDLKSYIENRINGRGDMNALIRAASKEDPMFLKRIVRGIIERSAGM